MKKCILILMVILTIAACKKENGDNPAPAQTTRDTKASLPDCITLREYYKISDSDNGKKAEWLRQRGDSVCICTLEEAILHEHKVVKEIVNNTRGSYTKTWGELKDIIKSYGYNRYLAVAVDTTADKIIDVELVNKYEEGQYCFSTALIRTLGKNYAKDDTTEFKFSLAEVVTEKSKDTQGVVVIQVSGTPYYFDYSTQPPLKPNNNMPF